MESSFWNVPCSGCGRTLRLTVSDQHLGRQVEATCPICKSKTLTVIGVSVVEPPAEPTQAETNFNVPEAVDNAMLAIAEEMQSSRVIEAAAEVIRQQGFLFCAMLGVLKVDTQQPQVEPKVDRHGFIKSDAFNTEDDQLLRQMKIKL